jgi:2-keto-4-pentenoate hydratase/2-oxohepta-3-ene-1,7-dioic acid hydratase in catechol pathway
VTDFFLLTFLGEGDSPRPGICVGDQVLDIGKAGIVADSTLAVLAAWETMEPKLRELAEELESKSAVELASAAQPLAKTRLLAPILHPGGIFCAAANYTDHMKEMSGREPPDKKVTRPYFFAKTTAHSIIATGDEIRLPKVSKQVDWEAEIGVVIGKPARNVKEADAMDYVAGYTIVNDLSLRDHGARTDWSFRVDWFAHKCFDTSAPMGPWITPRSQIADPYGLAIKLWVNDRLMQDSSSKFMHFTIAEQIAYLTERLTLRPGDVISTGTPSGVGRPRGIFLKPGDTVTVEIEGIGTLRNPVVQGD